MIAIIDYGMGNLRSVQKAFEFVGHEAVITSDIKQMKDASHIVLPGVGAIKDAVHNLNEKGLTEIVKMQAASGKPFLGICLGMQLLFDKSFENGEYNCLSLIKGEVVRFNVGDLKVPHMGWNLLNVKDNALFDNNGPQKYVYFVHTYHASRVPEENVIATSNYGYEFCAAVNKDNIYGLQFHPEKSGDTGLDMIRRFGGLK